MQAFSNLKWLPGCACDLKMEQADTRYSGVTNTFCVGEVTPENQSQQGVFFFSSVFFPLPPSARYRKSSLTEVGRAGCVWVVRPVRLQASSQGVRRKLCVTCVSLSFFFVCFMCACARLSGFICVCVCVIALESMWCRRETREEACRISTAAPQCSALPVEQRRFRYESGWEIVDFMTSWWNSDAKVYLVFFSHGALKEINSEMQLLREGFTVALLTVWNLLLLLAHKSNSVFNSFCCWIASLQAFLYFFRKGSFTEESSYLGVFGKLEKSSPN